MFEALSKIFNNKEKSVRNYKLDRVHISNINNGCVSVSIDIYQDRYMADTDIWDLFQIDILCELMKNYYLVVCQNLKFYSYPPHNLKFFGEFFEENSEDLVWENGTLRLIAFNTSDISFQDLKTEIINCNKYNEYLPINDDFPGYVAELLPIGDNLGLNIHANNKIISNNMLTDMIGKILKKYNLKAVSPELEYDSDEDFKNYIKNLD